MLVPPDKVQRQFSDAETQQQLALQLSVSLLLSHPILHSSQRQHGCLSLSKSTVVRLL